MTDEEVVFVVDDDAVVRDSLRALLESAGHAVEDYGTAGEFLSRLPPSPAGCLVVDVRMPDMDGLALQEELVRRRIGIPVIVMTGYGDVPLAVRAMRAGALDFIEKPFDGERILADVRNALAMEQRAKVGDALRGGISWRCSDAVNSLLRKGYATCQRLPSPNSPIHLDLARTR